MGTQDSLTALSPLRDERSLAKWRGEQLGAPSNLHYVTMTTYKA